MIEKYKCEPKEETPVTINVIIQDGTLIHSKLNKFSLMEKKMIDYQLSYRLN